MSLKLNWLWCQFLILWGPPNSTRDPDMNSVEQKQSRSFIHHRIYQHIWRSVSQYAKCQRFSGAHLLVKWASLTAKQQRISKHCCRLIILTDLTGFTKIGWKIPLGNFTLRPWGSWTGNFVRDDETDTTPTTTRSFAAAIFRVRSHHVKAPGGATTWKPRIRKMVLHVIQKRLVHLPTVYKSPYIMYISVYINWYIFVWCFFVL